MTKIISEIKKELEAISVFEKENWFGWYNLKNTPYKLRILDLGGGIGDQYELNWFLQERQLKTISFETVLDNSPPEVQEVLLFHLSLFA